MTVGQAQLRWVFSSGLQAAVKVLGSTRVPPGAQASFEAHLVVGRMPFPVATELLVFYSNASRKDLWLPHEPGLKVHLIISGPSEIIFLLSGLNYICQNAF